MTSAQRAAPIKTLQHEREREFHEEQEYIIHWPVPRYYAMLVGLALTPLGVVGFVPQFTRGGLLFHFMRDSIPMSIIYLVTGLAGFIAGVVRKGRYAPLFTFILTGVYLVLFSSGNIAFGNTASVLGGLPDIPWVIENALLVGLMLTGALITGLAALQHGDRATARVFTRRYGWSDLRARDPGNREKKPRERIIERVKRVLAALNPRRLRDAHLGSKARLVALLTVALAAVTLIGIAIEGMERRGAGGSV